MDGAAEEGTPFVSARGSRRVMFTPLIAAGVILVASLCGLNAQQSTSEAVSIGNDDIGGVVSASDRSRRIPVCSAEILR